ncbi:MAG: AAA family ATPase [Planctomycetaceae bacterium]|nr:AAA family ATPase [Planctomycetaceae bacterium]
MRGRSGFGKSRLISQFLQHEDVRSDRRSLVLSGRCYERESIPFKAFDPLIDQLTRELSRLSPETLEAVLPVDVAALSRLFPVLREVEQIASAAQKGRAILDLQELRQRAFVALRELLARLASRRCLILCLDDLQWCDPDSVPLFESLFFDVSSPNCLVIGAYREEDETSSLPLKSLLQLQSRFGGGSERVAKVQLTLAPLTPGESIELASQMLSAEASEESALARQIATEGQGSPFFIHVLATAQQDGPVESTSTLRLEDVLAQRIQALPEECRHLLEIVAVAGQPLRESVAIRAAACSAPQSVLTPLWTQGLLRQLNRAGRDCLETYHDKIRETLSKGLTTDRLRECHAKLAEFLEEDGTCDPETLARHFRGADNRPRAAQLFAAAAQQSTHVLAFDEATRLFREALALHAPDAPGLAELQQSLADALANAGRGAEAAQQYLACCQLVPTERRIELERLAARQWLISGHMDEGKQTMRSVLEQQGIRYPKTPLGALASLLWQRALLVWRGTRFPVRQNGHASPKLLSEIDTCWAIGTGLSVVDCIRGADFHARCLLKAAKAGDPQRLCRALAMDAVHSAGSGSCSPQHVEQLHTIAANLAQSIGTPEASGYIALTRGMIEFLNGRWAVARKPCEEAENIFRNQCAGLSWELTTAQSFIVFLLYYLGDLAELKRRVPALCREAEDKGDLYALTNHLSFGGILLDITEGRPDAGFAKVDELSRGWSSCGFHVQHQNLLGSRMQLLQYVGRSEEAWAESLRMRRLLKESQLERIHVIRIFNSLVMGRVAVSLHEDRRTTQSLADARELSRKLKRERFEWAFACASLVDAGIAGSIGDQPAAIRHLQLGIEQFHACEMHLLGNMAKLRLGQLTDKHAGQSREAEAINWLVSQGVHDPYRLADVFAPGFRRLVSD